MKMFFQRRKTTSRYYPFVGFGMLFNLALLFIRRWSLQVPSWLELLVLLLAVVLTSLGLLLMAKEKARREE